MTFIAELERAAPCGRSLLTLTLHDKFNATNLSGGIAIDGSDIARGKRRQFLTPPPVGNFDSQDALRKSDGAGPLGYGAATSNGPCEQRTLLRRSQMKGLRDYRFQTRCATFHWTTPEHESNSEEQIVTSEQPAYLAQWLNPTTAGAGGSGCCRRCLGALAGNFSQVRCRIHAASATRSTAEAGGIIFAVEEAVVVRKFLARLNVSQRDDPNSARDDVGFAVRLAGMVDKSGDAVAVDNVFAAIQTEKIGHGYVVIKIVGLFVAEAQANVFQQARPFTDRSGRVTTARVDARFAENESHGGLIIFNTVGRG